MKKKLLLFLLICCCITGCSFNKYYLTYSCIDERNEMSTIKHYDIDENFEFSKVVMNIYHLVDNHWKSVKTFEGKNLEYFEFTVVTDETSDLYLFLDEKMYTYQLENKEDTKYYDQSKSFYNGNSNKEDLELGYDEKLLQLTLPCNEDDYASFLDNTITGNFNDIDLNEEYENQGCDPYLLTYQFFK